MNAIKSLFAAPEVNPINKKARSVPYLNPINQYGRVFFFSWFSFLIAFWSWYAFPPLLSHTIRADLHLTLKDVQNSNIIALCATLLVRVFAGPACDRWGPRNTFAACLLIGAIPTFLVGAVFRRSELFAVRFFVGILGGSFVPCQVWSTGFYDKNVVGRANAFTAGLGNAGGGITYFLMPAIYDSLRRQGLNTRPAWKISFIVPGIIIVFAACCLLLLCPETPTGKWSERHLQVEQNLASHGVQATIVDAPASGVTAAKNSESRSNSPSERGEKVAYDATGDRKFGDHEAQMSEQAMLDTARGEVVVKPTFKDAMRVAISPQTLVCMAGYFNSFGAELAINSILGTWYSTKFPRLGQTEAGKWAAMFGLLNVAYRPLGGIISDLLYNKTGNVWVKKIWLVFLAVMTGIFLIIIGTVKITSQSTLFGLIAGMAFFLEAGNGANFSYVPHVHPQSNGIVSGFTGAAGNLGGIVFAIVFRYHGANYTKSIWIIGIIGIAMNLALSWVKPIPKGQIGGH